MSTPTRLRFTFSFLMSGVMSLLMSGWISWISFGFSAQFLPRWAHAFAAAWPAAFAIVLLLAPHVQRVSARLVNGRGA